MHVCSCAGTNTFLEGLAGMFALPIRIQSGLGKPANLVGQVGSCAAPVCVGVRYNVRAKKVPVLQASLAELTRFSYIIVHTSKGVVYL